MTDNQPKSELGVLADRIDDLEQRVETLEMALKQTADSGSFDRYTNQVITILDANDKDPLTLRDLRKAFRRVGIKNGSKIRGRIRDLESAGVIERVGNQRWTYHGDHE